MNTRTRIMSGITALALASGAIIMAPAAQAGSPVASATNTDKQVAKAMNSVIKFSKQSEKSSKRAATNCMKISTMDEASKSRTRLVNGTITLLVSAISSYDAADDLFAMTPVDYANAKQAAAADKASGFLTSAEVSLDVAFDTCGTIPEIQEEFGIGAIG